jgi:hypothetical protein
MKEAADRGQSYIIAKERVIANLHQKILVMDETIETRRLHLRKKTLHWTTEKIGEWEDGVAAIVARKEEIENVINKHDSDKIYARKMNAMIKRQAKKIREEERIGIRKKSSGRKRLMGEEDEKRLLKCIEEKSSAHGHGRRGDEKLYTAQRIKKTDFVKLINYFHQERNLPLIKSATTVFNRSKPHNKRSRQAKIKLVLACFAQRRVPSQVTSITT